MAHAASRDFLWLAREPVHGIEAVTARFQGHAYDMHRHEGEWLIGVTHSGVQDFWCRGQRRRSTAGRVILIEPGERHDGQAAHADGFQYSMLYLPATWLRAEMGGRDSDLGFRTTLANDPRLATAILRACNALLATRAEPLLVDQTRDDVVQQLRRHFCRPAESRSCPDSGVARRAMDYLQAHYSGTFSLDDLSRAAGASDRFQLARAFRRAYGTSPHACLVEIRLDKARAMLRCETAPSEAAFASGFADQSHLGRWFRRAYGVTPAAYRRGRTSVPDTGLRRGVTWPHGE